MKREILFRGKRVDNGQWVEGTPVYLDKGTYIVPINTKEVFIYGTKHFHWDYLIQVDPETIGQYTGRDAEKGIKIFEDDVIAVKNWGWNDDHVICHAVVYWDKDEVAWNWRQTESSKYNSEHKDSFDIDNYDRWRRVEVIGNIHDNPDY